MIGGAPALESFGEIFSAFRKVISGGDKDIVKKGDDLSKYVAEMKSLLNEKFSNDSWLSKQKLKDGFIDASDFSMFLMPSVTSRTDILRKIQDDIKTIDKYASTFWPRLISYSNDVAKAFDKHRSDDVNAQNANEVVGKMLEDVKAVDRKRLEVPPPVGTLLGEMEFDSSAVAYKNAYRYTKPGPKQVQAFVTKDAIKQASKVLQQLIEKIDELYEKSLDPYYSGIESDDHFLAHMAYDWTSHDELNQLVCGEFIAMRYDRAYGLIVHLLNLAVALNKWISRSIK